MKLKHFKLFRNKYLNYFLYFLIFIFSFFLVINILSIYKQSYILNHKKILNNNEVINDVNYIESWMTFNYINKVFNINEDYLKKALNINEKKYPNISLLKYSKNNNLDIGLLIIKIKNIIGEYIR